MKIIVGVISFIIWIVYYYFLVNRELVRKNNNDDLYELNQVKDNIFYLVRLDSLFFLIMFTFYQSFNNNSVSIFLYFVFIVSSLVFIIYDIDEKYDIKNNSLIKEKVYYIVSFLLLFVPIIYFIITKDITNTCFITLLINFLVPIIIYIIKIVLKK